MRDYILYTDGAYSPVRDQGGIAFVVVKDSELILEFSKPVQRTTNNRMELGAIILGLMSIKSPIDSLTIYSDSMYCIGTITKNWKRKKNIDLWNEFDKYFEKAKELCPNIKFEHVKGHNGDKWNEYCDKLASRASQLI